jgi:hypothetical protein
MPTENSNTESTDIRAIVTEALIGMIATITCLVPPTNTAPPPFIQAAIDRAVDRIVRRLGEPEKFIYPAVSTWPEWAGWIGLDATGYWVFYENRPETTEVGRIPKDGRWGRPCSAEPQRGWAEMIYERPTQQVRG